MAVRRNARLRREYLYKKSLEGKEKEAYEKKETLRNALATGAPLPGHLRRDAEALKADADLEDERTSRLRVRAAISSRRAPRASPPPHAPRPNPRHAPSAVAR